MNKELITIQARVEPSSVFQIEFASSLLPQQAENIREEINKRSKDVFLILSDMGFQFSKKIPLRVVDKSNHRDELDSSSQEDMKNSINGILYVGNVRLGKDTDGKWRDEITILSNDKFMERSEEIIFTNSLVHEFAHVWMLEETQFGKEIFPFRERMAQQMYADNLWRRRIITSFGEVNPAFHDVISRGYFRTLSLFDQFDLITEFLPTIMKEVDSLNKMRMRLFSQIDSSDMKNRQVEAKKMRRKLDNIVHRTLQYKPNNDSPIVNSFLYKEIDRFNSELESLIFKINQGISFGVERDKLKKDMVITVENLVKVKQLIKKQTSEPLIVSMEEVQRYHDLRLFIEGFSTFVEKNFSDEYRRRNPDLSNVLSNDKMNTDELFDSTKTTLLPYIKGLALFKSKYTTVREAMDLIRSMSIEEIQKEFLC